MPVIPICVDEQCPTNSLPPKDRQLFCFPRSEDLRRQWLEQMERTDLIHLTYTQIYGRRYRVCGRHFHTRQFQTPARKKLSVQQIPQRVINFEDAPNSSVKYPCLSLNQPCDNSSNNSSNNNSNNSPLNDSPDNSTPNVLSDPISVSSKFEGSKLLKDETTPQLVSTIRSKPTAKEKELRARLKKAENILRYRNKRIKDLSQFKKIHANPFSPSNLSNIQQIHNLPKPLRIFILCLLRNFSITRKNRRYTTEEKALFLSILKQGPRSYQYLQKILFLPSIRTLRRSLTSFQLTSGVDLNLLNYLKSISTHMAQRDRFCSLIFDEMDIIKNLKFSKNSNPIEGFMELEKESDHVLVFMIRGLAKKWKQPVAFFFTQKNMTPCALKSLIVEVIQAVHQHTDFRIVASVSNGGSLNITALCNLTSECWEEGDQFIYTIDGHRIFHLFDVPYILKSMRNNLMTNDIIFDGNIVRWSDIHRLHVLDGDSGSFKATKLTNAHVNPTNRQKMKVKLAAQVFSFNTASLLNILSKTRVMDAFGTAIFVKFMDDLFDSLNSVVTSPKPLACKLTKNSKHIQFWDDAIKKLNAIQFLPSVKCIENPSTVGLLLMTISNVKCLWDCLKEKGFKSLTLRSLNQDPLDNFFNAIRGLCDANRKPSPLQFADAYKMAMLNNTRSSGVGANCEDDGEEFLLSFNTAQSNCIPNDPIDPSSSISS